MLCIQWAKLLFKNATLSKLVRETFTLIGKHCIYKILFMALKKRLIKKLHPTYAIKSDFPPVPGPCARGF